MTSAALPIREVRGQRPGQVVTSSSNLAPSTAAVVAGIADWWASRAEAAGLNRRWLDVGWAVDAEPVEILPGTPVLALTGTAEQVGHTYVSTLPTTERSKYGRHYTPQSLADELWRMAKHSMGWKRPQALSGQVMDPACGAGALLLPVLREHLGAAARVDAQLALNALPNYISGVDNDPIAVWIANVLLASEMLPILARTERARRNPLPALVRYGDGLAEVDERVRVVIMNPPYGRVRLGDQERMRFSDTLYGHANLYGLFMAAAIEALDRHGVLAALVPTSFLAGRYFENLRAVLAEDLALREIEFVADRSGSFSGVLQETCLVTFTRSRARKVNVANINGRVNPVAQLASPRISGPWLLPRRADDAAVAAAAMDMPLTLASAGWKISTGPLVWNRRKSDLKAEPGERRVRIIWAADIDGGIIHRDSARDVTRFLELKGSDEQVMVLDRPAVLIQRTTAPEQSRRLISVYLGKDTLKDWGGRVVVENHVNVAKPIVADPALSVRALGKLFATDTIDRLLRCLSGSVAVSAYELEALRLPEEAVLKEWTLLSDDDFDQAVAVAYRFKG